MDSQYTTKARCIDRQKYGKERLFFPFPRVFYFCYSFVEMEVGHLTFFLFVGKHVVSDCTFKTLVAYQVLPLKIQ